MDELKLLLAALALALASGPAAARDAISSGERVEAAVSRHRAQQALLAGDARRSALRGSPDTAADPRLKALFDQRTEAASRNAAGEVQALDAGIAAETSRLDRALTDSILDSRARLDALDARRPTN